MTEQKAAKLNGIDLDQLQATVAAVQEQPEAAKLTFRGRNEWHGGFANDAHAEEMEQPPGNIVRRNFTLRGDHPPNLLGEDTGPTAGEGLLGALGSCIIATYTAHAAARGVEIEDLEVQLEGKLDLNGFLQLSPSRAGFQGIEAKVRVKSDANEAVLEEIRQLTTQASPVYDSVSNPVSVRSSVEKVR